MSESHKEQKISGALDDAARRRAGRLRARQLAAQYVSAGDPMGWFEPLYQAAAGDAQRIHWADLMPNPNLMGWLERQTGALAGRALVIGCGLGDDAEELARRGFDVDAFDVAPAAVAWCKERFPETRVRYRTADLLELPNEWHEGFDFVLEAYTLQVLPAALRPQAMQEMARTLAPGGRLMIIARAFETTLSEDQIAWALSPQELQPLHAADLTQIMIESFPDELDGSTPRLRALYERA